MCAWVGDARARAAISSSSSSFSSSFYSSSSSTESLVSVAKLPYFSLSQSLKLFHSGSSGLRTVEFALFLEDAPELRTPS